MVEVLNGYFDKQIEGIEQWRIKLFANNRRKVIKKGVKMYKKIVEDLKDKPEVARYILQDQLNMFEYFLEVFRYHNVGEIPEGFDAFYLNYDFCKAQVEKAKKQVQEAMERLDK